MDKELIKKVLYLFIIVLALVASVKLYFMFIAKPRVKNNTTPVKVHVTSTPTEQPTATQSLQQNDTDSTEEELNQTEIDIDNSLNDLDDLNNDINNLQ